MTADFIDTGKYTLPSREERILLAKKHLLMTAEDKGEYNGVREMRKHLCFYIKGMQGASRVKEKLMLAESVKETADALDTLLR